MVRDPDTGKYRRTRLFVLTLGYSRKAVRLLVHRSSAQVWAELHERAFRRLGGIVRVVVLDNLKEGVLTPDIYDPTLNPLYRDVLAHYGVVALPCRVRDPDRKGKVEASVGHTQKTPLRGLRFEHLDDGQAYLDRWDRRWADTRIHGTTKRQVAAMFAEERPALGPLPLEPFRYYQYGRRTVHLDGCVEVASAYYSAPPGWIGRRVDVQWDAVHVRLLDPRTGQLLGEHLRAPRGWHRIADQDRPARTPPKTLALLAAAKRAGPGVAILGVLALAKKHGPVVVEQAAAAALELGMPTYRFLKRYLDRRPAPPLSLRQVDPLIRQLTGNGKQKRDPYGHVKRDPRGWRVNTSILLRRSEAGHGSPTAGNPPSPPPPIRTASRRFRPDAGDPWRPVRRRGRPGRPRPGRPAATRFEAGGTTQGHQRAPFLPAAGAWFCFAAASLKLPPVVCSTVAWCTTRSMTAAAAVGSRKTSDQRVNGRFVVTTRLRRS